MDDPLGVEALHRTDRGAVIAELGVVVVLDDQPVVAARPGDELVAASRGQDRARRELMGGRNDDCRPAPARQLVRHEAIPIDRDGSHREPGRSNGLPLLGQRRRFEPQLARPPCEEDAADEREGLGEPLAHEDPIGGDADTPDAAEVGGKRDAKLDAAAMVAIVEVVVGGAAEGGVEGESPCTPREQLHVRCRGHEVVAEPRSQPLRHAGSGDAGSGGCARRDPGHDRRLALADPEVALRCQLLVRVSHDATRDAEPGRELARSRKSGSSEEATVLDRGAQGAQKLVP